MENLIDRNLFQLSGGEKQKVACASVAVANPEIIVLDEPSSNLDFFSIMDLREILLEFKRQGKTVIIAEHRLFYLDGLYDKIVNMKRGRIVSIENALNNKNRKYLKSYKFTTEEHNWDQGEKNIKRPASKMELRACIEEIIDGKAKEALTLNNSIDMNISFSNKCKETESYYEIKNLKFEYPDKKYGIDIENLKIPKQSVTAIIGHNGVGKSTLLRCLCGLEKKAKIKNKLDAFLVMQDVNCQFFTESVKEELLLSMKNSKGSTDLVTKKDREEGKIGQDCIKQENCNAIDKVLSDLDLAEYIDAHPLSLSGGQKQRLAIASGLVAGREVFWLDEPTSGLDFSHMRQVAKVIRQVKESGNTLMIITHDFEFLAACCDNVIRMEDGRIVETYPLDEEHKEKLFSFLNL